MISSAIPAILREHFALLADTPGGVQKLRELVLQMAVGGRLVERSGDWQECGIGELAEVIRGVSYPKSVACQVKQTGHVPLLRANNIGRVLNEDDLVYVPSELVRPEQYVRKNDLLIAMSSGSQSLVGKAAQALRDYEAAFGAFCGIVRFRSGVHPGYVNVFFQSPKYRHAISGSSRGIGINNLRRDDLLGMSMPLPTLVEQKRIVTKVDELMALCDELEARQEEAKEVQVHLNQSALTRLTQSADSSKDWKIVAQNFQSLEKTPENVSNLRKIILQLAVMGRLGSPSLGDPSKWRPVCLRDVSERIHYGFTASANPAIRSVRLLRITDIQDNTVEWQEVPGCEIDPADVPKYELRCGDILIARTGGTIGKTYLVGDVPVRAVFASYLIRVIPSQSVLPQYLKLFLESPSYWEQLRAKSAGTGQPNVNGQALGSLDFPLPPLAEQKRIVTKVGELMKLCDELEVQLERAEADGARLFDAVIAGLTRV